MKQDISWLRIKIKSSLRFKANYLMELSVD